MDFGPFRDVVKELNFDAHGVAVTLKPAIGLPISTSGIWLPSLLEDPPVGRDYNRREPRRVMALRRDQVASVPRGTLLTAPETISGTARDWQVDAVDEIRGDHIRVILQPDTQLQG